MDEEGPSPTISHHLLCRRMDLMDHRHPLLPRTDRGITITITTARPRHLRRRMALPVQGLTTDITDGDLDQMALLVRRRLIMHGALGMVDTIMVQDTTHTDGGRGDLGLRVRRGRATITTIPPDLRAAQAITITITPLDLRAGRATTITTTPLALRAGRATTTTILPALPAGPAITTTILPALQAGPAITTIPRDHLTLGDPGDLQARAATALGPGPWTRGWRT